MPCSAEDPISVILPVRNGLPWLEAALASVAAQTDPRWELLAIDDGSTDGSAEVLAAWARRDPRVRVLPPRPGGGLVNALNAGLDAARGRWVARLDADDLAHPERLAVQRALLADDPGLALVGSRVEVFADEGEVGQGMRLYVDWSNSLVDEADIRRERFVESPLIHPSVTGRRDVLRDAGGYRSFDGPEDYDLWLRLLGRGHRLAKSPRTLLRWRDRPDRLTRTDPRYTLRALNRLKLEHLVDGSLRGVGEVGIWGGGRDGRWWGWRLRERGIAVRAFVDIDPRKIGRRSGDAPIVAPAGLAAMPLRPLVLVTVNRRGARSEIRARLNAMGLTEGSGYLCLA